MAHEINSPLQGIAALLSVIRKTPQAVADLLENMNLLSGAFDVIRDTVKKLLDLSRPDRELKASVSVNRVIEDTVALVRSHARAKRVNIDLDLSPAIPHVLASPQHLGQVFMNLIQNASDAMEKGDIWVKTWSDNHNVYIEMRDNGHGIPPEKVKNIFDPFFTTKTTGRGLGMAVVQENVRCAGGSIHVDSTPGEGSSITVSFPASDKEVSLEKTTGRN